MACDPNTLLEQAKCINACIPQEMMKAVNTSLLCQILSNGGGDDTDFTAELLVGLIHYWKLEEASGDRLDSIGSVTLVETNSQGSDVGIHNRCWKGPNVAGSQFANVIHTLFLSPSTVAFWIKVNAFPGSATDLLGSSTVDGVSLDSSGRINVTINFTPRILTPLGALGAWHLVVVTLDASSSLNFSIDNAIFTSAAPVVPFGLITLVLVQVPNSLNGLFDELGVWNRALSQAEVNTLWNNGNGKFLV